MQLRKLISIVSARVRAVFSARSRKHWTASDWARIRAPEHQRDLVLSEQARRWMERLPERRRPVELASRFPRIVNHLAESWHDEGLTEHALVDLLEDKRGARSSFTPLIVAELDYLYEVHATREDEPPDEDWTVETQP